MYCARIGSEEFDNLYHGESTVSKIYYGGNQVWPALDDGFQATFTIYETTATESTYWIWGRLGMGRTETYWYNDDLSTIHVTRKETSTYEDAYISLGNPSVGDIVTLNVKFDEVATNGDWEFFAVANGVAYKSVDSWGIYLGQNPQCSSYADNTEGLLTSIPDSWLGMENVSSILGMFAYQKQLQHIPDSWFGLSNCYSLTAAFKGCTSLTSIPDSWLGLSYHNTLYSIFISNTFKDCTSLTSIPNSWGNPSEGQNVYLGDYSFGNCTSLTSIPDSWEGAKFGGYCNCTFENCTSLTSIPDSWEGVFNIVWALTGVFSGCTGLTSIPIPVAGEFANVTNISFLFDGCTGLTCDIYPFYEFFKDIQNHVACFRGCVNAINYDKLPDSWI